MKDKNKQKILPRINTEFHGKKNKQKQKILPRNDTEKHGNKTLHSEPDALATVVLILSSVISLP